MILNELKIMIEISEGFEGRGAKFLMNMVSPDIVYFAMRGGFLFLKIPLTLTPHLHHNRSALSCPPTSFTSCRT